MKENLAPFPTPYVMTMILDHCREVQILTDHERILKATVGVSQESLDLVRKKIDGELGDLALYLENYFSEKQNVLNARREKMREYRKHDKCFCTKTRQ